MTKRKFYKTVYTVTVLSEDPVDFDDMGVLHYHITEGECSGDWSEESHEVDGKTMAELLIEQGSDPGFFRLDEEGNDEDEEDEDESNT